MERRQEQDSATNQNLSMEEEHVLDLQLMKLHVQVQVGKVKTQQNQIYSKVLPMV